LELHQRQLHEGRNKVLSKEKVQVGI